MSQHDFDFATADGNTGVTVRAGMNAMAQALASNNSGAAEPATPYANMWWADITSGYMKQRNAANNAWLTRWQLSAGQLAALSGFTLTGLANFAAGADIASAATIDLTAATGNFPRITGTTPTSAVTMNTGQPMFVVADGAWPLTYHATTNKLNTGADYTCKAGDVIFYYKDNSGIVHGEISRPAGVQAGNVTQVNQAQTTVASGATVILGGTLQQIISGTSPVSAFEGVAGVLYHCIATGAFPIYHNPPTLSIKQTGANITLDAGATFDVYMLTTTTCEVRNIQLASGSPLTVGYFAGAGGTVTQATSKTTGVTLNKPCGKIIMHNAALAAGATVSFTLTNSLVSATDVIALSFVAGTFAASGTYLVWPDIASAGAITINVKNNTTGSLSEAVGINFAIIKGVAA